MTRSTSSSPPPVPRRNWFDPIFNSPLDPRRCDALLELLEARDGDRVIDIGCGNGEMLRRLAREVAIDGLGIDSDPAILAVAAERNGASPGGDRLSFRQACFDDLSFAPASFDRAICVGATHAFGDMSVATVRCLAALRELVRPGARVLLGEGFWQRQPDPAYLEVFRARPEDLRSADATLALATDHDFEVIAARQSSPEEWDAFELEFWQAALREARAHPDDPAVQAKLKRRRRWYEGYRRWGRDTLGFLMLVLERSPTR